MRVDLDHDGCTLTLVDGLGVPVGIGDERLVVTADTPCASPADSSPPFEASRR